MQQRITFIGGGNMAISLIGGLLQDGHAAELIQVVEPVPEQQAQVATRFGVHCASEADLSNTDIVVLAVKPQVLREVARDLAEAISKHQPLVITIAAGIRCADLSRWLNQHDKIVRCMPNTPALIQAGATGLFAMPAVSAKQRTAAESLLRAVGLVLWVDDEALIDAVTALSGSGPAYFFRFMEALQEAGTQAGLPREQARLLTLQTALGAARMALESREELSELRRRVTSPGGTTEAALNHFDDQGLSEMVNAAVAIAAKRAGELADEAGDHSP